MQKINSQSSLLVALVEVDDTKYIVKEDDRANTGCLHLKTSMKCNKRSISTWFIWHRH